MKRYTVLLILLGLTATFADAQFPLKIPKIRIPNVETPKTETPQELSQPTPLNTGNPFTNNRQGVADKYGDGAIIGKPQNRQMVMDDSVTVFDVESFEKRDAKLGRYVSAGWYLKSNLRILGTFPNRSAFRVLVKKNGKKLSNVRCEGSVYRKDKDRNYDEGMRRNGKDMNFEDFMRTKYRCFDEKQAINELGNLDVEIYFIDGDTDTETLAREYVIDVREAKKVDGLPAKSHPAVSDYYIQRHAESAVAFANLAVYGAYADGKGDVGYLKRPLQSGKDKSYGTLEVFTSMSPPDYAEFSQASRTPIVRCSVNGQRIKFKDNKVGIKNERLESAIHSDRNAAKYRTGVAYEELISFSRVLFRLPIYSGEIPFPDRTRLEDYPGKWECDVRSNGVVLRTFRWEVGSDGRMIPHPEQANGNVNLFYNANLIEMEIPDGGGEIDGRLLPIPNAGFFYGIPWSTAEGKAMAGRVPKKGNPYPVSSDKRK